MFILGLRLLKCQLNVTYAVSIRKHHFTFFLVSESTRKIKSDVVGNSERNAMCSKIRMSPYSEGMLNVRQIVCFEDGHCRKCGIILSARRAVCDVL